MREIKTTPEPLALTPSSPPSSEDPDATCLGDTSEIVRLFTLLGLTPPDTKDTFSISYINGILSVDVVRVASSTIEAGAYLRVDRGFSDFAPFNPKAMPKKDRNKMMQEF